MSGRPPVAKKRQVPEIRMNRMNDREKMSMLKKWKENKLVSEWNAFWRQEEGVGVIEVVLILVVICTSRCPCVLCVYREILDVIWNMIHREEMFCVCSN